LSFGGTFDLIDPPVWDLDIIDDIMCDTGDILDDLDDTLGDIETNRRVIIEIKYELEAKWDSN
jgi:hypothetical protein